MTMKFLIILALAVSAVHGAVQGKCGEEFCGATQAIYYHNQHDKSVATTVSIECLKNGSVIINIQSPDNIKELQLVAGSKKPAGKFQPGSDARCRVTAQFGSPGNPSPAPARTTPQYAPLAVTTPAPFAIEDDIFASLFARKAAVATRQGGKSTTFVVDYEMCGDFVDAQNEADNFFHFFHLEITEILYSGHPDIILPHLLSMPIKCCTKIVQPPKDVVTPTVNNTQVARCDSCQLALAARATGKPGATPDTIVVEVTSGTCPDDPVWNWSLKRLSYDSDDIVANSVLNNPVASNIQATLTTNPQDYQLNTDYVVLDDLRPLPITAGISLGLRGKPTSNIAVC